ncbi:MAG: pyridine nucleotide-disulfide oxidoreductase, partial [Planctomycetes bacterium]|nr:pyridine nucleotide-disulfide oxidoreductase [Planctomycetota bacterium]
MPLGGRLRVCATDLGFGADIASWCNRTGNKLLDVRAQGGRIEAVIEKSASPAAVAAAPVANNDKTIIVFSGDLDRVLAAFVIANGAVASGSKVTMFFTFWGLNALRRPEPVAVSKGLLDQMFGWMMPRGADRLKLSKMNMAGMGTALMKHVMKTKNVNSLPDLMQMAQKAGVKLVACTMSMDVMGITKDELIDGLEFGGVATYLAAADSANVNLFI